MGQRHQVYIRLPAIDYGAGNPNNRPATVIGLHHQWLYGRTAVRMLANFFRFYENTKTTEHLKYWPFGNSSVGRGDADALLCALWSTDVAEGYFHRVHSFQDDDGPETTNPYTGDNNDGITVIDLTDQEHPAYCFFTLDGIEASKNPGPNVVLSAKDYVLAYYPDLKWHDGTDARPQIAPELAVIAPYRVLSRAELGEIFPALAPLAESQVQPEGAA